MCSNITTSRHISQIWFRITCRLTRAHSFGTIPEIWEYMEVTVIVFFWDVFWFWNYERNSIPSILLSGAELTEQWFVQIIDRIVSNHVHLAISSVFWQKNCVPRLSLIMSIFVTSAYYKLCSLGNWYSVYCSIIPIPE